MLVINELGSLTLSLCGNLQKKTRANHKNIVTTRIQLEWFFCHSSSKPWNFFTLSRSCSVQPQIIQIKFMIDFRSILTFLMKVCDVILFSLKKSRNPWIQGFLRTNEFVTRDIQLLTTKDDLRHPIWHPILSILKILHDINHWFFKIMI